jgi:hypothetical protein
LLALLASDASAQTESSKSNCLRDEKGEICVGRPKIWRYDRVFGLIDGMLRDIEAVSVSALTGLDPNSVNAASLDFLQQVFRLGASFDQGDAVKQRIALENLKLTRETDINNYQIDEHRLSLLRQRREGLQLEFDQTDEERGRALSAWQTADKNKKAKACDDDPDCRNALGKYQALKDRANDLSDRLAKLESQIKTTQDNQKRPSDFSTSVPSPTAATLDQLTIKPGALGDVFNNVPQEVKDALKEDLKKPSLPVSMRLNNYMTLLNERMSKQLAVFHDDSSRLGRVYLLGLDVSLYPSAKGKQHVARAEFQLKCGDSTPENLFVYDLYPGASSYNISQYYGKLNATGLAGAFKTLAGFGVSSDYQRQRVQLRSGLVQSIYVSGFAGGDDVASFGWYYAPSPFEQTVSPGVRTTYALVVLPEQGCPELTVKPYVRWQRRDAPTNGRAAARGNDLHDSILSVGDAEKTGLKIERLSYEPYYYVGQLFQQETTSGGSQRTNPPEAKPTGNSGKLPSVATVQIEFREPVDPNLVITVGSGLLRRVRDIRGRAVTTTKDSADLFSLKNRSLLEAENLEPNTWMAIGSRVIVIAIGPDLASALYSRPSSFGRQDASLMSAKAPLKPTR